MGRAFPPRADCPQVPTNEAISISPFSFDVSLPPLVTEFPIFDFVPPEPPSFDFGCYPPGIGSSFSRSGAPKFNASVGFPNSAETGKCEPVFDFDVCIPCSKVEVDEAILQRGPPALEISFTDPDDECAMEFNFDLTIPPCPAFTMTKILTPGPEPKINEFKATIIDPDVCTYEFELDLTIPPCVSFTMTKRLTPGPAPQINEFKDTLVNPDECIHELELDLTIPPCVTISPGTVQVEMVVGAPSVALNFTKTDPDECLYDCDFDLEIPDQCVNITAVATIEIADDPDIEFIATKTSSPSPCDIELELNIKVPAGGGGGGGAGSVCRAKMATTENISLAGLQTIDGVSGAEDDIVLVKDQTDQTKNGAYKMKEVTPGYPTGAWVRTCTLGSGTVVGVRQGDLNGQSEWMVLTEGDITIGVTPIVFGKLRDCCCSARVATTGNITLNGLQTVDGIALADGDICLVRAQTDPAENGPYLVVDGDDWVRTCCLYSGHMVSVRDGWTNGHTIWMLDSEEPFDIGTTLLEYKNLTEGTLSVRAATIKQEDSLSGEITIDGVPLFDGDLCLVRVQDDPVANGPYLVKSGGAWERIGPVFHNQLVNVREGEVNEGTTYQLIPILPDPIVVGTTGLKYRDILHSVEAKAATAGTNITLSGTPSIDGVTLAEGDILLVKDQTDKTQNGPYVVNSTKPWKRIGATVPGQSVKVREGNRNGSMEFFLSESAPVIEGTTLLNYMSISPELGVHFAHHATFSPGLFPVISLSGNQTIDGYTTSPGQIVLVRDRTHGSGINGLYVTAAGAWTKIVPRPAPFVARSFYLVFVAYGNVHFDTCFISFSNFETTRGLGSYFRLGS